MGPGTTLNRGSSLLTHGVLIGCCSVSFCGADYQRLDQEYASVTLTMEICRGGFAKLAFPAG